MTTLLRNNALGIEPQKVTDPGNAGAIPVDVSSFYVELVTAGAETRTLADPQFQGQLCILNFVTDAGDCVVTTASAMNQTGNNTITFADVGDHQILIGSKTSTTAYEWREVCNDGAGLSTV